MAISKGVLHLHGHPLAIVDLCPQNTLCRQACLKTRAQRKRVQAAASRARMDPHGDRVPRQPVSEAGHRSFGGVCANEVRYCLPPGS